MKKTMQKLVATVLAGTMLVSFQATTAFAGSAIDEEDTAVSEEAATGPDAIFDQAAQEAASGDSAQIDITHGMQEFVSSFGLNITVTRAYATASYVDSVLTMNIDGAFIVKNNEVVDTVTLVARRTTNNDWKLITCTDTLGVFNVINLIWLFLQ